MYTKLKKRVLYNKIKKVELLNKYSYWLPTSIKKNIPISYIMHHFSRLVKSNGANIFKNAFLYSKSFTMIFCNTFNTQKLNIPCY